jgi:uncharacterized protein YndB with AHSA1/START domain
MNKLSLRLEGDTVIVVERSFPGPPEAVFRAHTEPKLIQQWMLGPPGWSMHSCVCELKVGGKLRYDWSDGNGGGFFLTGEFLELDAPHRIVHVERMHLPDPTPDNRIETTFTAEGTGTRMVVRMTAPSAEVRKMMLESGMEQGMEASYARLEASAALLGSRPG